ncbi:unnamed protein product [Camellia sinensis]
MEKYEMGEVIGSGAFGVVNKGLLLETKQTVAIKTVYASEDLHSSVPSTIMQEISPLKEMEHANIVKTSVVNLYYMPPQILLGSHLYSTHVDKDRLHKIFSIMGTPDATKWPGVTSLPDYIPDDFPKQDPKNLAEYEMLCINPARRISALDALAHAYFENDDGDEEEEEDYDGDDAAAAEK